MVVWKRHRAAIQQYTAPWPALRAVDAAGRLVQGSTFAVEQEIAVVAVFDCEKVADCAIRR